LAQALAQGAPLGPGAGAPLALADALLREAERSSNPAPLIAAARALVAEAASREADVRRGTG
jgi:hypothetical protein